MALLPPMCPSFEGAGRTVHALEQWTVAQLAERACAHALRADQRRADALAAAGTLSNLRLGSPPPSSAASAEFLSPVSPYRRSASALEGGRNVCDGDNSGSTMRSLSVLEATMGHLLHCVLPRRLVGLSFASQCGYLSDRFRQVKKELQMQSLLSQHPIESSHLLEAMLRFHIVAGFVCFGEDPALFDASMNRERTEDCMQELLACTTLAITRAITAAASSSSSPRRNRLHSQLLARQDRFRAYSILMRLQSPWLELRQYAAADSATAAASSSSADARLSPRLRSAVRFCSTFHTCDYASFLSQYKLVCDPSSGNEHYDPLVMCLLHPHLLPLQTAALRRLTSVYAPNSWYPLHTLHGLLATPSVPDAMLLCKSLCGLLIRRPDSWTNMPLEDQERDASVEAANIEAATTGNVQWAVQIVRTRPVTEADPLVFKAFYQRELKRRLERTCAQAPEEQPLPKKATDAWDDDAPAAAAAPVSASSAAASSAGSSSSSTPLWSFLPHSTYAPDCIERWVTDDLDAAGDTDDQEDELADRLAAAAL